MTPRSSKPTAVKRPGSRNRFAFAALVGALMGALVLSLASCRGGTPGNSNAKTAPSTAAAARDAYDLAEMDFKTPPAV